jgi:CBS-domain-containing membrane protein
MQEAVAGHLDKLLSIVGGLVGLSGVLLISEDTLGLHGSSALVASMGASAVLLFAVPHGPLSQPWPLLGGHLLSAAVGVACAKLIAQPLLAAPTAVALAIGVMHYLRCIHPPGGATALSAVVGGEAVHRLGFEYLLTPVLINVLVILLVAVVFNYAFPWRRYPSALLRRQRGAARAQRRRPLASPSHSQTSGDQDARQTASDAPASRRL